MIRTYCEPRETPSHIDVTLVDYDPATGRLDLADLERKLSERTAAVYVENPSYLGTIEAEAAEIARLAHEAGAELIVGVDPISLGVLAPPGDYGADIVVGTTQPLGVHMSCGGGVGGFIASRDEERYAREYPTLTRRSATRSSPGERGFGVALFEQTSYGSREEGNDWTGNSIYLWAIAAAAYMSLLGPSGFEEVGELILQRSHYAASLLDAIPGVRVVWPGGFFKEFVVAFDDVGLPVAEVNRRLRPRGIFGGKDLSRDSCDARAERALLRDRGAHPRGHRAARRGARGGAGMNGLRRYHAAVWDEPLVMELTRKGRRGLVFPEAEAEVRDRVGDAAALVPAPMRRAARPDLPELSEPDVLRHYLHLAQETLGMMGISLFGTCTMKYNPRLGEALAARPELSELHPHQHDETLQGVLALVHGFDEILCGLSGMERFVFQAGGGAHASYTFACLARAHHASRGELDRATR